METIFPIPMKKDLKRKNMECNKIFLLSPISIDGGIDQDQVSDRCLCHHIQAYGFYS